MIARRRRFQRLLGLHELLCRVHDGRLAVGDGDGADQALARLLAVSDEITTTVLS